MPNIQRRRKRRSRQWAISQDNKPLATESLWTQVHRRARTEAMPKPQCVVINHHWILYPISTRFETRFDSKLELLTTPHPTMQRPLTMNVGTFVDRATYDKSSFWTEWQHLLISVVLSSRNITIYSASVDRHIRTSTYTIVLTPSLPNLNLSRSTTSQTRSNR